MADKKKISVDIDMELYEKFNSILKKEDIFMTQQLRKMIKKYVEEKEAQNIGL